MNPLLYLPEDPDLSRLLPQGSGSVGFEDYLLATAIPKMDSTRNWCHERAPMSVPRNQGHEFTGVHKTLDTSVPSALPGFPGTPTVVQSQQKSLRNLPHQFQQMRKGRVATSSRSSQPQADVHDPPRRQHMCNICGKEYAQRQGLTRHHRAKHEASLCIHCHEFKSGRPYLRRLREHLERQHPEVDPNAAVEVVKRNGRRATYLARGPAPSYPITAHVPTPAPHVTGFRSSLIHVTTTIDPSRPTYISRTLPPDDGIRSSGLAESPNGTSFAGILPHRYWARPSYGN